MVRKGCALAAALFLVAAVIAAPGLTQRAYAGDGIAVNADNFPDANFRVYLSEKVDSNHDGYLSSLEISNRRYLYLQNKHISDLKGIEYFTALKRLDVSRNDIGSMDISRNINLIYLTCYENQLTELDVSNITNLRSLYCGDNQLTSLDVSNNTALSDFRCGGNQLTSLDVSNNTALNDLDCNDNLLTSIDVRNNTALKTLDCGENQLSSLDLSRNPDLTSLACDNNQLTTLNVSDKPELNSLFCHHNQLTSLDVSRNTKLDYLHCGMNQLSSLDVSRNTELRIFSCGWNQLTSLDVSKNTKLTDFFCKGNQITSLDVSNCARLNSFSCAENQLKSLDLSANTLLVDDYTFFNTQAGTVNAIYRSGKLVVDLENDLGLDMSRVSDVAVTGGTYSDGKAYFDKPLPSGAKIAYNYDTQKTDNLMDVTLDVEWTGHTLVHHDRVEPTCTEKGRKEHWTCSTCGSSFSDEAGTDEVTDISMLDIPALGHDFSGPWEYNGTGHWRVCSRCGEKSAVEAHSFGSWRHSAGNANGRTVSGSRTAAKHPAAAGSGAKERTCSICGYVERSDIAAVTAAGPTAAMDSGLTRTGDDSRAALWVFLMITAVGAGFIIRLRAERGRN